MRVPRIFIPGKSLDYKIEELSESPSKDVCKYQDPFLYETIFRNLRCCLHLLKEGPVRIFWISDKHQESKYEDVEEMVNNTISESGVKLAYETHDYYGKNFERADIFKMLDKAVFSNQVQIVYVDHKTTETLKGDPYMDNSLLFDHSFVITV